MTGAPGGGQPAPVEQVFVVERAAHFGGDWPQGFVPLQGDDAQRCLASFEQGWFAPRPLAEDNPAWKQPITYCVLVRDGEPFVVERTRKQSETRLHGLLSIGIGGHVNPEDSGATGLGRGGFARALRRELDEELFLDWSCCGEPEFLGLLNDDETPVGRVHVGLVYRIPVHAAARPESVSIREISKMSGGFRGLVEFRSLWQDPCRFESWSRILLQAGILDRKATSGS